MRLFREQQANNINQRLGNGNNCGWQSAAGTPDDARVTSSNSIDANRAIDYFRDVKQTGVMSERINKSFRI